MENIKTVKKAHMRKDENIDRAMRHGMDSVLENMKDQIDALLNHEGGSGIDCSEMFMAAKALMLDEQAKDLKFSMLVGDLTHVDQTLHSLKVITEMEL